MLLELVIGSLMVSTGLLILLSIKNAKAAGKIDMTFYAATGIPLIKDDE